MIGTRAGSLDGSSVAVRDRPIVVHHPRIPH
jgi:hypothetical protein